MSDENPYAAPLAEIVPPAPADSLPYASRWNRFWASFLDGMILAPVSIGLNFLFAPKGGTEASPMGIDAELPIGSELLENVITLAVFLGINWVFLKNGQTIGKKIAGSQIQHRAGGLLSMKDMILKRILPVQCGIGILMIINPWFSLLYLLDSLAIFRAGHNTLHDDLAGTVVLKLPS